MLDKLKTAFLPLILAAVTMAIEIQNKATDIASKRAETDLRDYIERMGQAAANVKFTLSVDGAMKQEEWKVEGKGQAVAISGGSPRGLLYGVYHYLEDACGVRWWSPREEDVPKLAALPSDGVKLSGVPAFEYRGIFSLYARDKGWFAARMRMNDDHNSLERLSPEYGGTLLFGPPAFVHTFGYYVHESNFDKHPEWFSLINGKRFKGVGTASDSSQRCLSNMELRAEFKRRLREFIKQGEENAKKLGIEPPKYYVINQNDGSKFCQCDNCMEIVKREGALSGIIIDFINDIARDIAPEHPEIIIVTSAYNKTEIPPKHIHPEKNVMIDLSNMRGNSLFPADPKDNPAFYGFLDGWSKISNHLMIWDYNINYREYNELAYPSEFAYKENLKLYREKNVSAVFAEFESPNYSDVREYKIYLWLKLMENPDADFDALSRQFAEGYYGKAGELFLKYRKLLRSSVEKHRPYIIFTPTPDDYTHLDIETMTAAQAIFDEGEKLLKDDKVLLDRWHDAKISLNRGALYRSKVLHRQYLEKNGSLDGYPFPPARVAAELREVWKRRLPLRPLSQSEEAAWKELEAAISLYGKDYTEQNLKPPKRFSHTEPYRLIDFTMENSGRFRNFAELTDDAESEAGFAARIRYKHNDSKLEDHLLPIPIGIYSKEKGGSYFKKMITAEQVPSAGYHWYKLGVCEIPSDAYMFFFKSWLIQQTIGMVHDAKNPSEKLEVWVSLKFTGPAYPHGKADDENSIWVDRVVLIRPQK